MGMKGGKWVEFFKWYARGDTDIRGGEPKGITSDELFGGLFIFGYVHLE